MDVYNSTRIICVEFVSNFVEFSLYTLILILIMHIMYQLVVDNSDFTLTESKI
jgi:hypothetical protein